MPLHFSTDLIMALNFIQRTSLQSRISTKLITPVTQNPALTWLKETKLTQII